jgi:soluble lytic murein transglycosylase
MPKPPARLRFVLSLCVLSVASIGFGATVEQQRPVFLRAEQALKAGRTAEADSLIAGLADYPLLPHLIYRKLAQDLDNAPAIEDFLVRYRQTRQAGQLRQRWLERLAEQGLWAEFVKHYQASDNTQLQCAYYLALANVGRTEEAFAGAEKLWPSGSSLPANCEDRLFKRWQAAPSFTREQIWHRYALALRKGNMSLADALTSLLPQDQRGSAEFWRRVHEQPMLALDCSTWNPNDPLAGRIFAHAIDRLADNEPLLAQTAWALHKNRFAISPEEIVRIDRRTALALAAQRYPEASAYLLEMPAVSADAQIRGWRVRAALSQQDWPAVLAAISMLNPEEQVLAQWRYWRGRALEALGDQPGADAQYRLAAQDRDYYGFSAADRIQAEYPLASKPAPVAEAELNQLAAEPAFLVVTEWLALQRDMEARSDWQHAIKPLDAHGLLVAAKLAQRLGLDNLAITTLVKAGYWDDLDLRFPLAYAGAVAQAAQSQQVDPVLIYALVRRESAFDANAGSPVGAVGLMQLMPATGEQMARRLGEAPPSAVALLDPGRNLRYGSAYLHALLERFGNQFAPAAAAYNAGPNRVERWLPKDKAMLGDLWVETIPYSETRQYVAAVLFHAVIYQARLNQPLRRLADFLPALAPGPKAEVKDSQPVSVPFCD